MLRDRGFPGPIGFFLHTPFPSLEVLTPFLDPRGRDFFREWVAGILGADLAGFQTEADLRRFRQAAVTLGLAIPDGDGLRVDGRPVHIGAFPVGIDFEATVAAASLAVVPAVLTGLQIARPLVVGLERADYTKGIPERLRAIATLYREGKRFSYVGIASPTREGVAAYDHLRDEIDAAAAECAALAPEGVLFLNTAEALHLTEVMGLLHAADIVCTSSLSDGMNLVPLQAVASHAGRPAGQRAVILTGRDAGVASAFAGCEAEGLVPLDPLDPAGIAAVLRDAVDGRLARISDRLVQAVRDADATGWGHRFLDALEEAHALR
jgi:trehalose 6-phosphate synthase